jgi:transporter family protein
MTAAWQFWALLSAAFAAATAILAKVGVDNISPDVATLIRTMVVLPALFLLVLATGQMPAWQNISGKNLLFLTLSGLATGLSWICYFRALKLGNASQVAPIDKLSVVLVALFAVAFLGERLTASHWAGILLIAAGALLLSR